ncbi:MAG TPA: hypothetical protein VFV07_09590 [Rhizomicrobium sp.]|nr:hypothetical protein [Rhizomicrobium sp.]
MNAILRKLSLVSALAGALMVGGCATEDEVQKAQATADQAMSAAQAAQQTANQAQSAAQSAQQGVDQLRSDVNSLNQRVDDLSKRHGQRG